MMLRTPPPKKQRTYPADQSDQSPGIRSDQGLVIYEDALSPVLPLDPSQESSGPMLCTYQCRQMVKSEFLDSLSTAEKKVRDYEFKLETMNENFCKVDAERKNFLEKLLYTEQELAAAKARERAFQEQLLKEVIDSEERLKRQMLTNANLEVKLQNELNLRLKAESSAASYEEKVSLLDRKLGDLSQDMERKKKRFDNELTQIEGDSKLSIYRITTDLKKMEQRVRNAEKESELLVRELESLKTHLNECLQQKSDVEKKLSTFTLEEGTSNESTILVKHLQEQLRNYESEVREARKLKVSHENITLLKEKLLEEKGRKEKAELEISRLQEIQFTAKRLEDELSSWKSLIEDIPGVMCSDDIPVKIASLQKEVIVSTMKMGEANARVKQLDVILEAAQIDKQNAETEAGLAQERAKSLKSENERIELLLLMVTEERDKLKSMVKEMKWQKNDEAGNTLSTGSLVQELESSLANKESTIKELENRLNEQKEVNTRQYQEIKLLNEKLNNEARKIKSLERESDQLRSEVSLLESKLGHGDFSAANTKILRMVNTLGLDNETKQTIEALQTELHLTKEKLQAVEELRGQPGDAGKLVDSYISGKIVQLKEQIATLEKREERYKTVFADRISVFRRACCELFGYKIVMDEQPRTNGIPVTRFTLHSIYAQFDDEKLEFEYESGNTIILANDYTSQPDISTQVEIFIRKLNSIPAFTANLTVESFNRRTLC